MSDRRLGGRRIVVTGAGRGLGRALAIVAADEGADVVLLGRDARALEGVAEVLRSRTGRDAMAVPCDLGAPDNVTAACRTVLAVNPVVDVLVNNGAPWLPGAFAEISDADVVATVAAAVSGTILVTKGLLSGLRRSKAADVVTIVSTAGWPGWDVGGASVAFHAAKHGQSGFSDRLRHELKDDGIRVTAIYPPDFEDVDPTSRAWDELRTPAGGVTNRDVVSAVLFVLTAPRPCAFPVIIIDAMRP